MQATPYRRGFLTELRILQTLRGCGWFASRLPRSRPADIIALRPAGDGHACAVIIEVRFRQSWSQAVKALLEKLEELERVAEQAGATPLAVACAPPPARCRLLTPQQLREIAETGRVPEPQELPTHKALCNADEWCGQS